MFFKPRPIIKELTSGKGIITSYNFICCEHVSHSFDKKAQDDEVVHFEFKLRARIVVIY